MRLPVSYFGAILTGLAATAGAAGAAGAAEEETAAGLEFFESRIRPVLVQRCYKCHSEKAKKLQAGLRLDSREGIRRGGESGPAVVPGSVGASLLLEALRHETVEMPPDGRLPVSVIADFEAWIGMGAPDPRDEGVDSPSVEESPPAAADFWCLQPLRPEAAPEVAAAEWPSSDIDRFLLARMEQAGLAPADDADRATLARRAYFDLVGMPPTIHELDEFLRDERPDAFARLVDRLLENPHFGERWGRHWLDIARFAQSSGGGRTLLFPLAWRYRDYVFRSFNEDKPYDQFIVEQFAGDLLPYDTAEQGADQLTATGFLVLGPTNYELQDKELLRMEVVDEQIDTMGRAVLGLTIGCARCHDHKFDPIPTADYYALAGIFRSTKTLTPGNVSGFVRRPLPVDDAWQRQLEEFRASVEPLEEQIAVLKREIRELAELPAQSSASVPVDALPGVVQDDSQAQLSGMWKASSAVARFVGGSYSHASQGTETARYELNVPQDGRYQLRISYSAHSNRASNARVTVHHADGTDSVRVNQRERPLIDGLLRAIGEFSFEADKPAVIVIDCRDADGAVIADAVQLVPVRESDRGDDDAPDAKQLAERQRKLAARQAELGKLEKHLTALEKDAPPDPPEVMSVRDEQVTEDYHICIRGNVHHLGSTVPRGFLTALPNSRPPQISPGQSGRLEVAAWLVDPQNPLTARVMVNRIWLHLFGQGLVRTPDNFGAMGERPSHPELLDHLAARFMQDGWSVKKMIRRVMLSRAYRLSSRGSLAAEAADPENRLLSHQNRRRLDAEALRDAMLLVSGRLNRTMGGSSMKPGTRQELGYEFDSNRRSVYLPVFRNTLPDIFQAFDFADPNLVVGRRSTSTLPTQALYLMNSPFVMEQAKAAAGRLLEEDVSGVERRIRRAYRRTLGRPPEPAELETARQYLAEQQVLDAEVPVTERQLAAWGGLYHSLFSCIDFRYLD